MRKPKPKEKTFNVTDILDGNGDGAWIEVNGAFNGVFDGDYVLVDRSRKNPRDGDLVAWGNIEDGLTLGGYFKANGKDPRPVYGIATALVRKIKAPKKSDPQASKVDPELQALHDKIERLEGLPENESERFRLETEIYRHENQSDEWPEVISA